MLAFSEACERNKKPILARLRELVQAGERVLEIGSGTGQHAAFFGAQLPEVTWQPTDVAENLPGIEARLNAEATANVLAVRELDVADPEPWPVQRAEVVFAANVLHIVSADCVEAFFRGAGEVLGAGGRLVVYGPFRYRGQYTSDSNARFDEWLRVRDPVSGIRDFEWVDELARAQSFELLADHAMPANNQLLAWQRGNQ